MSALDRNIDDLTPEGAKGLPFGSRVRAKDVKDPHADIIKRTAEEMGELDKIAKADTTVFDIPRPTQLKPGLAACFGHGFSAILSAKVDHWARIESRQTLAHVFSQGGDLYRPVTITVGRIMVYRACTREGRIQLTDIGLDALASLWFHEASSITKITIKEQNAELAKPDCFERMRLTLGITDKTTPDLMDEDVYHRVGVAALGTGNAITYLINLLAHALISLQHKVPGEQNTTRYLASHKYMAITANVKHFSTTVRTLARAYIHDVVDGIMSQIADVADLSPLKDLMGRIGSSGFSSAKIILGAIAEFRDFAWGDVARILPGQSEAFWRAVKALQQQYASYDKGIATAHPASGYSVILAIAKKLQKELGADKTTDKFAGGRNVTIPPAIMSYIDRYTQEKKVVDTQNMTVLPPTAIDFARMTLAMLNAGYTTGPCAIPASVRLLAGQPAGPDGEQPPPPARGGLDEPEDAGVPRAAPAEPHAEPGADKTSSGTHGGQKRAGDSSQPKGAPPSKKPTGTSEKGGTQTRSQAQKKATIGMERIVFGEKEAKNFANNCMPGRDQWPLAHVAGPVTRTILEKPSSEILNNETIRWCTKAEYAFEYIFAQTPGSLISTTMRAVFAYTTGRIFGISAYIHSKLVSGFRLPDDFDMDRVYTGQEFGAMLAEYEKTAWCVQAAKLVIDNWVDIVNKAEAGRPGSYNKFVANYGLLPELPSPTEK